MIDGNQLIEVIKGQMAGRKWGIRFDSSSHLIEQASQELESLLRCAVANDVLRIELMPQPDEITLPARTIPAPLRDAPKVGYTYYLPNPCDDAWFDSQQWYGDSYDFIALKNGQCYSTPERAIAAAKAQVPYES